MTHVGDVDMTTSRSIWAKGAVWAWFYMIFTAPTIAAYPVAVLYADPLTGSAPLVVAFNGSDSWDTQGLPITRYVWNFNDGSPVVEGKKRSQVHHIFEKPGEFDVYLTVYNTFGQSKTAYQRIKVSQFLPSEKGENEVEK
jgi:PKD repeat protein